MKQKIMSCAYPFILGALVSATCIITPYYIKNNNIAESADTSKIKSNLEDIFSGLESDIYTIEPINESLNLVILNSGGTMITDNNGKFIIHALSRNGMNVYSDDKENLTQNIRTEINKDIINNQLVEPIVYQALNEVTSVDVFIEPFCGYCHVFHNKIQDYLDAGITVKYYPFPIFGDRSKDIFGGIWSITDKHKRKSELEKVIARISGDENVNSYTFEDLGLPATNNTGLEIIEKDILSAKRMGINATPAIVTEAGLVIPGAVDAEQIIKTLN